jgi:hypothetical protein
MAKGNNEENEMEKAIRFVAGYAPLHGDWHSTGYGKTAEEADRDLCQRIDAGVFGSYEFATDGRYHCFAYETKND